MVVAPALIAASTQRHRNSCSDRDPSSADHSTSSIRLRAMPTLSVMRSRTCSGSICSLYCMCRGLVAMKVWMRPRSACLTAAPARSISPRVARARPAMVEFLIVLAISETASKSPSEAMGKPASMTSTPMSSSTLAMRSFSSRFMDAPGDCSPSRKVVSKMMTWLGSRSVTMVIALVLPKSLWAALGWDG